MATDTIFEFVGIGLPAAAARGINQQIKLRKNGKIVEYLSGADRDMTRPSARGFEFSISGSDIWAPPFAGMWIGEVVTVHYPGQFVEPIARPQTRPEVPGTLFYIDAESRVVEPGDPAAAWRVYNPLIIARILDWELDEDDWGALVTWSSSYREALGYVAP
jgi:hypothetical protein